MPALNRRRNLASIRYPMKVGSHGSPSLKPHAVIRSETQLRVTSLSLARGSVGAVERRVFLILRRSDYKGKSLGMAFTSSLARAWENTLLWCLVHTHTHTLSHTHTHTHTHSRSHTVLPRMGDLCNGLLESNWQ